jgi:SAM-dependent methyltransferase
VSPRAAQFEPAWRIVADAADVGAGTSLLDLGCGDGGFCAFAARRGATVHGLDVEPDAIARALEEVPQGEFRLGLMERLPWPDDAFDVVTSFNALQYALDTELAVVEACRVVGPAGRIAICKWGPPAHNEFFAFLIALGAGGVRSKLPATDPLEDALRTAGVDVLLTGDVPAPIEMADDRALEAALERAGIEADPRAVPDASDLAGAAAPYRRADGSYRFDNRLRYWIVRPQEQG